MMTSKKKTALLLTLSMGIAGTAYAAPVEADLDSRLAALEQKQADLEQEISALRAENRQLKLGAGSQKKQINAVQKSAKEEQERIQISGFGRASWDNDNIKGYIDRNDNRRFYLDLKARFKVNDRWNFNFESETNQRYANYVTAGGELKSHHGHDDEDGVIQRVWAEGRIGNVSVDVGRRWRGLGYQNVLFGNESDGVVLSTPIPKTKLTAQTFYLSPTDKGYNFSAYGVGVEGEVARGLKLNLAYAKLNVGRNDSLGQNIYDAANPQLRNTVGSHGYVLSAMYNPVKNIYLIGDYVRPNAVDYSVGEWGASGLHQVRYDKNSATALRLNYRWTNLNDPGSFQLYARWYNYTRNQNNLVGLFGDKEWGALQPGSRGWILGFKYVPAKNVEWETFYQASTAHPTLYGQKNETYRRNFFRTMIDYHF